MRKQLWKAHSEAVAVLPVFELVVAIVMLLMVLLSFIQLPNCRNLKMRVIRVIFVVFVTFLLRTAFSLLNSIGNVGYDYRYVLHCYQPFILHMFDLLPRSLSCGSYPQGACLPCQPTSILVKVLQTFLLKSFYR